jgi:transcription initiation factor TFIIA small subunit
MASQYQLYRESTLGKALTDTLDELIQEQLLDPQTAMKVLSQVQVIDCSLITAFQKLSSLE